MKLENNQNRCISVQIENKVKELVYIGPCMWGTMYRSSKEPFFYRFIPLKNVRSLEIRKTIQELTKQPHQKNIAHIGEVEQIEINKEYFISIRYDILEDTTLTDIQSQSNPQQFIAVSIKILKELLNWWSIVGEGFIPMPADIVFLNEEPYLLGFPGMRLLGLPKIEDLFLFPERIYYLGNEIFRGKNDNKFVGGRTLDLYSLGFTILQGVYKYNLSNDPEVLLIQKSKNVFLQDSELGRQLPFWYIKVAQIQVIFNFIHELIDNKVINRASIVPSILADFLHEKIKYFIPDVVIDELLDEKKPKLAFELLQDLMMIDNSAKYQIRAGEIAKDYLKNPFEAFELFEGAIKKNPTSKLAYSKQLETLLEHETFLPMFLKFDNKKILHSKLDSIFRRNFSQISIAEQKEFVSKIAEYYLMNNQNEYAAVLIHPFLFNEQKYLWWEFEKILIFIKALMGQKRYDEASNLFNDTKRTFLKAKQEGKFKEFEIQKFGKTITEIERILFNNR